MTITHTEALARAAGLLPQRGAPVGNAATPAQTFVEAKLKGHPSQGLQRLPRILACVERGLADPGLWRELARLSNTDFERVAL